MTRATNGRFTAKTDEPFAVFIIGMRINDFLAVRKWFPTLRAMGPMLRELNEHPEKGFLGADFFLHLRGPMLVQYWRSFADLERFARNPDDPHLPAWRRFNQHIGSDGSVGVWHETYTVEPGGFEAVYVNMPPFGLAGATERVPATGRLKTARSRLLREAKETGES
jgi:hypothetical protein